MNLLIKLASYIPEVKAPEEKKLSFSSKLKWTLTILISFFLLSVIPLFGLGQNALQQFEQLSIILGASFGSLLSLGIGPIVTASIVLQLLAGSGLLHLDQTSHEGRVKFQALQKVATIFFIIFEGMIYVFMGGLAPDQALTGSPLYFRLELLLIAQLIIGGVLIMYMDGVVQKYGFGSGVSLFIAAGVSSEIVLRAFSPLNSLGNLAFGSGQPAVGAIFVFFSSLVSGALNEASLAFFAIFFTFVVFVISVYAQAMKVEIPLSFGRVRGYGIRWPLNFLYTSNIPVILVAAMIANVQLWAQLLQNWVGGGSGVMAWISQHILGQFSGQIPISGLVKWLFSPNVVEAFITGSFSLTTLGQILIYSIFMVLGAVIFSLFWVQTANQGPEAVARQIMASGLQIPGFRRDERVIEHLLQRYIFPLTVMGGISIGILAASADLLGALSRGTGILLAVMIIYRLYEDIARQHMMDMYPALRKMMGGS